jgi:hypothetical protein
MIRERREHVVNAVLEALTGTNSPTSEEVAHFVMVAAYFGVTDKVDALLDIYDEERERELQVELAIGVVCHVLNRLMRKS